MQKISTRVVCVNSKHPLSLYEEYITVKVNLLLELTSDLFSLRLS